jgi:hypothetical protein
MAWCWFNATESKPHNVSSKAMKITTIIFSIILGLTFFACDNSQSKNKLTTKNPLTLEKKVLSDIRKTEISTDTLYKLLDKSNQLDNFEFSNWKPFLYIKTGNILSKTEKNAILVSCPTDSTYKVELYTKLADSWTKNDEIELLDAFPIQFNLDFEDYNFDGQTDMYLQTSVSNGYALSRGHLLTINPKTKKIQTHPEAKDLANIHLDSKTKTVISEDVVWSVDYGFQGVCDLKNKWINGKLKIVKRECPSKKPRGNQ